MEYDSGARDTKDFKAGIQDIGIQGYDPVRGVNAQAEDHGEVQAGFTGEGSNGMRGQG